MDVDTKEIVGLYVGSRSRKAAKRLWLSLPPVYRQCAVAYSDFWQAYQQTLPSKRHKAVGKETGKTNYPIALQLYYASTYCSVSQKDALIFKERARIILVLFGFLSTTTIAPYMFSTTQLGIRCLDKGDCPGGSAGGNHV